MQKLGAVAKSTATMLYCLALVWFGMAGQLVVDALGTASALRVVAQSVLMVAFPALLVGLGVSLSKAARTAGP